MYTHFFPATIDGLFNRLSREIRAAENQPDFSPAVEISESETAFEILLSAPGLTKESFKIELKDRNLTVSGERSTNKTDEKTNVLRSEFRYGSFSRSFQLPANADTSLVDAFYENGLLRIVIPKDLKTAQPNAIVVK